MSAPSRTSQFSKLHKVLKKHYKPVEPDPERPVLEHLLLACCLENAHHPAAEEALAALVHTFFDWNEIRVSTIRELAEVMAALPDPPAAASRVKRVLQHVFEGSYAFDLEDLRKSNLGPATERLAKIDGATAFSVSYVVQSALGGHAIPVDTSTLAVLHLIDLVSDEDVEAGVVPGLERAISKSKGVEFGSLLHQLGAHFTTNRYCTTLHEILLQVNPDAKDRLPRRRSGRKARPGGDGAADTPGAAEPAENAEAAERAEAAGQTAKSKAEGDKQDKGDKEDKKKGVGKKSADRKKGADVPSAKAAASQEGVAQGETPPPAAKKPAADKKKSSARKKSDSGKSQGEDDSPGEASSAAGLSKRKPR